MPGLSVARLSREDAVERHKEVRGGESGRESVMLKGAGRALLATLLAAALAAGGAGCWRTKAGERSYEKKHEEETYAGFGANTGMKRTSYGVEMPTDEVPPEKAVAILADYLQRQDHRYYLVAEQELIYWAQKQGVAPLIVSKVRMLLRNPRIEVRAPALRLVVHYGNRDTLGDLIEVLNDEDYGMRKTAFEALRWRAALDFGYDPTNDAMRRQEAVEKWRSWWQDEQRKAMAARNGTPDRIVPPPPPPEVVPPSPP